MRRSKASEMGDCSACGKPFVPVDGCPEMFEPACDCLECRTCHRMFRADDIEGPTLAATDELAARFGDGHCDSCWERFTG